MDVAELFRRFPEIPVEVRDEPLLAEYARELAPLLRVAREPSPCARVHERDHRIYLELIGPLAILRWGLATKEETVGKLQALLARHRADPPAFAASFDAGAGAGAGESTRNSR